jgi:hypothetical protein
VFHTLLAGSLGVPHSYRYHHDFHHNTEGRNDTEVGMGMIFCQLARLRALQHDALAVNGATDAEIEQDPKLSEALSRLSESLSGLGFAMPVEGRVPVHFAGLGSLILTLEHEFAHVIESGRSALGTGSPVEYMALQDLFPIGAAVTSTSVGGLGTVRVFQQKFTLEDAIGSHACSLEALPLRVTNGIPFKSPLLLPVSS